MSLGRKRYKLPEARTSMHDSPPGLPNWPTGVSGLGIDHRSVESQADDDHLISWLPASNSRGSAVSWLDQNAPPHGIPYVAHHRGLRPCRLASMALLVSSVVGLIGWFTAEIIRHESAQDALANYAVAAARQAQSPPLTAPANSIDPAIWTSGRSGMARSGVDLSMSGFQLRSASITPASDALTTLLIYRNAEGKALALTVRPDAGRAHARITAEVRARHTAFTWVDNGISYKLVSDMPPSTLFMIAVEARKQTCHRRTDVHLHGLRDGSGGGECEPALRVVGKV